MSLIRRGFESRAYPQFAQTSNPLNVLYGSTSFWSTAGERVDEITALGISSVLSCVSLLADSVATMPLRAYRDGSEVPLPGVLADPDPENSTPFEFMHQVMVSLGLHGKAFIHIERTSNGQPVGLTPLHPYQVNVLPAKGGTGRMYLHMGRDIPPEDMIHVRWFSSPQALDGISPLAQQRTMMGLSLAVDRFLASWYAEGGTPSGVLETERPLTTEQARVLRETWEGTQRKHRRPAVLSDGLKWRPVQTSAVDMQFIETYDLILQQVARIYRIPPHLLNVKSAASDYANVEQSSINYLTYTLAPWLRRLEINLSKLLPSGAEVRFDPSVLLRLDAMTKARVDLLKIQSGVRTPNEARALDGDKPYDGGDKFVMALPGAPMAGGKEGPAGVDPVTDEPAVVNA